jgi:hypothetical protein
MNPPLLVLIGIGLCAGVLLGVFGIGGGVVIVLALINLTGFRQHMATGTSLSVLLPPVGVAAAVIEFEKRITWLQRYYRPILCTEYMARGNGSTFQGSFPIAQKYKMAAINWGFVAGKTQAYLPWDSWQKPYIDRRPAVWFHEILGRHGPREPMRPPVEERLDVGRRQRIAGSIRSDLTAAARDR